MIKEETTLRLNRAFARDVKKGLTSNHKYLPSKYFYDSTGDKIFQEIMTLDEYYLTRCEMEILQSSRDRLIKLFGREPFRLIEFGAGNALKTKVLLDHLYSSSAAFSYEPIDISPDVLNHLCHEVREAFPGLRVRPVNNDYFRALSGLTAADASRKVILFLGSSIGNMNEKESIEFLVKLRSYMGSSDLFVLGLDLKKDPETILAAYNDRQGITGKFNLNLLERINSELGADFDLQKFIHCPVYDPVRGEARSFLLSTAGQGIHIKAIDTTVVFHEWEGIHTEISRKYDIASVERLASRCGFRVVENFYDSRKYFIDTVWQIK